MFKSLFSKQKWLIEKLPSYKMDTDELVRELLFSVFLYNVEERKVLDLFPWDEDAGSKVVKKEIDECLLWIKEKRPLLVDKINTLSEEFPDVPEDSTLWKFVNENHIGDILGLQQTLRQKDQTVLKSIIGFLDHLVEI